jgi:mono/diheme cytochrome c family protein
MNSKQMLLILCVLLGMTAMVYANPGEGKAIFTTRCAGCHNVNKQLTGPALAGVHERRSMEWIVKFVKSSQAVVKSGDKDAVALYQQFNRMPMPDHSDLTSENIKSIVDYIKAETVIINSKAPFAKPGKRQAAYLPPSLVKHSGLFIIYLGIVALLIAILLLVVRMNDHQPKADEQQA